jgi:hypothetical protein
MLTRESEIGRSLFQAPPEDRALLDLSVRRKVKDDVVAAVLRLQPEEVVPRREAALDRLATIAGIRDQAERARLPEVLADLPADQWPADNGRLVSTPQEPPAAPPAAATPEPAKPAPARPAPAKRAPAKRERRRRPTAAIAVVVVGALLGGAVGLLLFGGDSDDDGSKPAPAPAAEAPAPKPVELQPVSPDFPARGTASIEGSGTNSRLTMSLSGLPPREEAYAVWLYNAITDAVLIDRVVGTSLNIDEVLPADPADYKYIDVSQEPIDDNPNHSGASVMRIPVDELLKNPG